MFWEDEVERMAAEHGLTSFTLTIDQIKDRMREKQKDNGKNGFSIRKIIDEAVIQKPSVTFHMIMLSLLSIAFWIAVAAFYGYQTMRGIL